MKRLIPVLVFLVATASVAGATTPTHHHKSTTKVSLEAASKTALEKVPGGKIESHELEKEHGKLIYSFDISVPGKSGIEEVHVDAHTGKFLAQSHESEKKEKSEEAKEAKEAKEAAPADTGKTPH